MSFVSRTPDESHNWICRNSETVVELLPIRLRKTVVIDIGKILVLVMPLLMPASTAAQEEPVTSKWLQESIYRLREESHLVGVGTTLLIDGENVAAAVSGKRRQGSDVAVTVDDKWHIGSITKSMTATSPIACDLDSFDDQ